MVVVNFIIQNILTQAAITIALIAMLGLLLQRKSFGAVLTGTFKTLLGSRCYQQDLPLLSPHSRILEKFFSMAFI